MATPLDQARRHIDLCKHSMDLATWILCVDYKDFNSHHCIHLMSYFWRCLADEYRKLAVLRSLDENHEIIKCCEWMCKAELNAHMVHPERPDEEHRVHPP